MDSIGKIIEHASNPLTVDIPEEYRNRKLVVIVRTPEEEIPDQKQKK